MTAPRTGPPPSARVHRIDLAGLAAPVATARRLVLATLADWLVGRPGCDDAALVAGELVANAVLHGGGPRSLVLTDLGPPGPGRARGPAAVRVAVTDGSPRIPSHRPGGHGLVVVRHLSRAWGHHPAPPGKTVWAEVPHDPG
ncbi:ATP-binding protein [Kitasatospora sp. NPDC051853]|uniref:ATP-binding protein n=1 Tax=Kitasatospora sp. NPDC051853 TaxID=3364058 RepID=UPI0037A93324